MGKLRVVVAGALCPGREREVEDRLMGVASVLGEAGHESVVTPIRPGGAGGGDAAGLRGELAFVCPSGAATQDVALAAILEAAGAHTVGAKWLSLALSHDALKVRQLLQLYNVATAPYYHLEAKRSGSTSSIHGSFGFPALVHPRNGGPGQSVRSVDELGKAQVQLGSGEAVVERAHAGDSIGVAVLHGRALGVADVRGRAAAGGLSSARRGGILKLAERSAEALDGSGAVFVTLGLAERANECVLDVDLCPELSAQSMFVRTARDAGHSFGAICDLLVREAHARLGERLGGTSRRPPARQFQAPTMQASERGSAEAVATVAQTG